MRLTARVIAAGVCSLLLLAALYARPEIKVRFAGIPRAEAQGVGTFSRTACTAITAPVTGQTFCFDQTANALKFWTGAQWVTATATQSGVNNIRDFGAVGDGVTDDTTAIQAAITAGSGAVTYVPQGTFIYSQLTLPSNTTITGPGTLKWKAGQNIAADKYSIVASGTLTNINLVGITIDGNKTNQTGAFRGNGMLIRGVTGYRIESTVWQNWHYDAIEITSATQAAPLGPDTPPADPSDTSIRGRINGNLFTDIGRNSDDGTGFGDAQTVQFGSTVTDLDVTGNVLINCINGIKSGAYNRRINIVGNIIANVASLTFANTAISVEQLVTDAVVSGNTIVGPYQEGILIESSQRVTAVGNTIYNAKRGFNVFSSAVSSVAVNMRSITISGNTITHATSSGSNSQSIRVTQPSSGTAGQVFDVVTTGNTIVGAGNSYGIQYSQISGGAITGNSIRSTVTGIACEATCTSVNMVGNRINAVTAEGIFLGGSPNNRVLISGNVSTANAFGIDITAGQASVTVANNVFLGNTTADIRNNSGAQPAVIFPPGNTYVTTSGTVDPAALPTLAIGNSPASAGSLRLPNSLSSVRARNAANSGDITVIGVDGSDRVQVGGGGANTLIGGSLMTGNAVIIFNASPSLVNLQGLSASASQANNLRGQCTFAAASTCAVTFANNEVNGNYFVTVTGNGATAANTHAYGVTAQTTAGFTILATVSNSNTVTWHLIR